MERELDKIERRFKVYSREQEKGKPEEAETGNETEKTTACGGGDNNNHNKKRYREIMHVLSSK